MATTTIELKKGLRIGETQYTEAEIREPSAGDVIEAMEESERLIMVPGPNGNDPQLVASPTMVGVHTLRRQIVRIGTYQGPLSLAEIKRLSPSDLDALQTAAAMLEAAAVSELARRGRDDSGQG